MNAGEADAPLPPQPPPPLEDGDKRLPVTAILVALVGLLVAALAIGIADGVPAERPAAREPAAETLAIARLCFCGPGGEAVDFPAGGPSWQRTATR